MLHVITCPKINWRIIHILSAGVKFLVQLAYCGAPLMARFRIIITIHLRLLKYNVPFVRIFPTRFVNAMSQRIHKQKLWQNFLATRRNTFFSGRKIISIAAFWATCTFNNSFVSLLRIINILRILNK